MTKAYKKLLLHWFQEIQEKENVGGLWNRWMSTKLMRVNNKIKNVIIIILIVCFVFSGSNNDQGAQGHQPLGLGWFSVSKIPKIKEFCFDSESTKKKRFEKRPNVCKWLKILSDSLSQHPGDRFKLFRLILALKLTKIQTFEISNIFGSLSFGRRPKNIEEILSKVCRPADFSLENFKKVIFWSKNLVSELIRVKFGLESSFKYWNDNFKCFFDTIEVFFGLESSLKWLLRKSFEHSNKIKQVGRVDNVGHVGNTHADHVRCGWDMSSGFTLVSSMATVSTTMTNPVTMIHLLFSKELGCCC
jgi:hypothetical protein